MSNKPFTATLTDLTRSFIQGHAGNEFYRLERDKPQQVSRRVASALKETLYEVKIEGEEPATDQIAKPKQEATNGRNGNNPAAGNGKTGKEEQSKEKKAGTKTKANGTKGNSGAGNEQQGGESDQHGDGSEHQEASTGTEEG